MLGLGLVTSFHCVAMCGALVVTYAVKDGPTGSVWHRLTPHLTYQSAKIASYVVVGLVLGAIGAAFDLAGIRGWVMLAAGLFMILLGINMTGHFPLLRKLTLKPPKALVRALSTNRKKARAQALEGRTSLTTPLVFGLLTGLMPCGPLQAAQLTAAGTGSAATGAIAMLGFGLGTAPLMIAFGVGSGYLGEVFKRRMNWVAAAVIIILGLVLFNRGSMLVGSPVTFQSARQIVTSSVAPAAEPAEFRTAADGVAEIDLVIENTRFVPETVNIPADTPVRIIVDRREDNTCSDQLAIPQAGVLADLAPFSTTAVDVPPLSEGTYTLTCGMGMMSGRVIAGASTGGVAGSPLLGLGIAAVILGAAGYALTRRESPRSREVCPAPAGSPAAGTGRTILGFSPAELLVVCGVIAAAVIAGLALGGVF